MKKIVLGATVSILALSLCACSKDRTAGENSENYKETPTAGATSTEVATPTAEVIPTQQDSPAEDEKETVNEELFAYLSEISQNYFPGSAGCSLVAIKYAGQMLDLNSEAQISPETVISTGSTFVESLEGDAQNEFPEKINGIYYAAQQLLEENAQDALDSAGYEAKSYPWTEETVTNLFTALYEGLGYDLPDGEE